MSDACSHILDPRIRRTREQLQTSLGCLLETHDFEKISVQDITDAAGVNRATFYAHYPDKFALLECMVADRFQSLLTARNVRFDGTCNGALSGIILGVCDYLAQTPGVDSERQLQMEPHIESAIVAVVRGMVLQGFKEHPSPAIALSPEMMAATVSWAIYGAAKEWVRTPDRAPSEQIANEVLRLILPILQPPMAFAAEHPVETELSTS
jgi:AcrR family transcriptional regulator